METENIKSYEKSSVLLSFEILTFNESKQAITLPLSTWQLLGGWANLHSSSLREQVPLWNCRHTSRVSHFVSRIDAMFRAMSAAGVEWSHLVWRRRRSSGGEAFFRVSQIKKNKTQQLKVKGHVSANDQRQVSGWGWSSWTGNWR